MGIEEQVGDTVKLALQKYWTFFGVAGLALMVFAAGDGFPKFLVQLSPGWQEVTFVAGCVFVVACFAVVIVELLGVKRGKVTLPDIGMAFVSPDDGDAVSPPVRLVGTLERPLPEGFELWLFGCADQISPSYWPQARSKVNGTSWTCEVTSRWTTGADATYVLALVGPDGQALIQLYWELNLNAQATGGRWAGVLKRLTSDMAIGTQPRRLRWRDAAST